MLKENWRVINGFSRYMISDKGRVKSLISNKIIKPMDNGKYYQVKIFSDDKKASHPLIHRLVCQHFIDNPNNLPSVNHRDEDKHNNCVENLEWCSMKDNCNYGTRNERMAKSKVNGKTSKAVLQYDLKGNLIKEWNSALDAQEIGVCRSAIQKCTTGIHSTCNGFIWLYKTDDVLQQLKKRICQLEEVEQLRSRL